MQEILKKYSAKENGESGNALTRRQTALYRQTGDLRSEFLRDYTRIIHSSAYRRLKHKTQVFFSPQSDHICTRIEHVNHVESISYTIAKYLGLNCELTKAIAVAHDLGHPPFGHKGEGFLSEISKRDLGYPFWHEQNGLFAVDHIELLEDYEKNKRNLNLTYAVRDGIISHCGEVDLQGIKPRTELIRLEADYLSPNQYEPVTYEGCVVKAADKIAYIGRDMEDAYTLGILDRTKLSLLEESVSEIMGKKINNTVLINSFINDICENSSPEKGICFSDKIASVIRVFYEFNLKYIYQCERVVVSDNYFKLVIGEIYDLLAKYFAFGRTRENLNALILLYPELGRRFTAWLDCYTRDSDATYKNSKVFVLEEEKSYKKAILTYIAGMTDKFAIDTYNEIISF